MEGLFLQQTIRNFLVSVSAFDCNGHVPTREYTKKISELIIHDILVLAL